MTLGAMAYAARTFAGRYAEKHPDRVLAWIDRAEAAARKRTDGDKRVDKFADAAREFVKGERSSTSTPKRRRRSTTSGSSSHAASAS